MAVRMSYMDDNSFDTLMYGLPHPGTIRYLENQMATLQANAQNWGLSQQFVDDAYVSFQNYAGEAALAQAKAILQQEKGETIHHIQCLQELALLQTAAPNMQRWIMANPYIRQAYINNTIDGYSGLYQDTDPGVVGHEHYDYRRVMDGVFVFNEDREDGDKPDWEFTTYYEPFRDADNDDLDFDEQLAIIKTWEAAEAILRHSDDDPTDTLGNRR